MQDTEMTTGAESFSANVIRATLRAAIMSSDPSAVTFDELPLCRGVGRADLAAVNGSISGFEIKSGRDSLERLPLQIPTYQAVFDYCYVVVTRRHLANVRQKAPRSWGIYIVESFEGIASVRCLRKAKRNSASIEAQGRLLWKPEIVKALRRLGSTTPASTPVLRLWDEFLAAAPELILENVRDLLKARAALTPAPLYGRCGDSYPIEATAVERPAP